MRRIKVYPGHQAESRGRNCHGSALPGDVHPLSTLPGNSVELLARSETAASVAPASSCSLPLDKIEECTMSKTRSDPRAGLFGQLLIAAVGLLVAANAHAIRPAGQPGVDWGDPKGQECIDCHMG